MSNSMPHNDGAGMAGPQIWAPPPQTGAKARVALLPGVLIAHRILKNFRYWSDSRRGTVGGIKRSRMSVADAADYTESIFRKIDAVVVAHGGWAGKRVLEVGPGDSLGTGLWSLGAGAGSYLAVDRFAVELDQEFEEQALAEIRARMNREAAEAPRAAISLGSDRFLYRNDLPIEQAPGLLGRASFDVIFSNAVLEHVADLEQTLQAMWDLLGPGGVMFHDVDLRSHQTFEAHPLHFLEYPGGLWRLMSSHNGEPNRVRLPRYLTILKKLGFLDIKVGVTQVFDRELVEQKKSHLAAEFRELKTEDLQPAVFWFTCRKP